MLMSYTAEVIRGWPYDGARDSNELIQQGAVLQNGDVVALQADGTINKVGATAVAMAGLVIRGNGDGPSNANSVGRFPTPQPSYTVSGVAWASGIATVTVANAHGYAAGNSVTLAGFVPTGYNGSYVILTTPTSTTFTVALAANPGTVTTEGTVSLNSAFDLTGQATVLWGNYIVRTSNYAAGAYVPGSPVKAVNGQFALGIAGTDPIVGYVRRVQGASATQTACIEIEVL